MSWQIAEQGATQLTVKVDGDGSGSVTSSPAGINCGSDCTETYDPGTGVTLTATPQGGSTFAGWGGACSGASYDMHVDDERGEVRHGDLHEPARLERRSRSGNGNGTVTSSPAGINCGGGLQRAICPGNQRHADRRPRSGFHVRGMDRRLWRRGSHLLGHDGRQQVRHGDVHVEAIHAHRDADGCGQGHG